MENTCKKCGCELEPHVEMVPHYNGGTVPESVDEKITGYYPCFECHLDSKA